MKRDRRRKYQQCSDDQLRKAAKQRQIEMEVWNKQLATPLPCISGDLVTVNRSDTSTRLKRSFSFQKVRQT